MTYNVFGGTLNPAQSNPIQKSRPLRLKVYIFCLYFQKALTNFHDFWHTLTLFYSEHIHLFLVPEIHHAK